MNRRRCSNPSLLALHAEMRAELEALRRQLSQRGRLRGDSAAPSPPASEFGHLRAVFDKLKVDRDRAAAERDSLKVQLVHAQADAAVAIRERDRAHQRAANLADALKRAGA